MKIKLLSRNLLMLMLKRRAKRRMTREGPPHVVGLAFISLSFCLFASGQSGAQTVPNCQNTSIVNWQNVTALKGTITISGSGTGQSSNGNQTYKFNNSATIQFTVPSSEVGNWCARGVNTFYFSNISMPNV